MKIVVTLPAADLDRAKAWYSKILDLEPVEIEPMGEVWYEVGGSRFMVYSSQFAGTNQATAAGLLVDDVEATVARIKSRGASPEDYDFGEDFRTVDGIMTLPNGRKAAWVKDSEGNILGLSSTQG
jgi:predicted enzyme related to lactoylglutathione lyase